MSLLMRRLMMMAMEVDEVEEVKTIVDYTVEEETDAVGVALTEEQIQEIFNSEEIYFCIELKRTASTETAGKLIFGIYNTGGFYVPSFINQVANVTPTSAYDNNVVGTLLKNLASETLYQGIVYYPQGQYSSKCEARVYSLKDALQYDSDLLIKMGTDTVFGVGTRLRFAVR